MGMQSLFLKEAPTDRVIGWDKNFNKEVIVEKPKQKSLLKIINVKYVKKK